MRISRLRAGALCAVVAAVIPAAAGVARAQPPVAADVSARADALNKRAVEALKRDAFTEAEPLARQAWELKQSYDIASNLGLAELGLRRPRDAAEHLAFALRTFPANGKPEHKKLVELSLSRATSEVGAVELTVSVDGAAVFVDDRRVGTAPLRDAVFLEPGAHVVRASLAGYEDAKQDVRSERGRSERATLTLAPTTGPTPPPTASTGTPPPPAPSKKSVPLIVTGFGVAAAGVALGIGGLVASGSNSSNASSIQQRLGGNGDTACNQPTNATDCADLTSSLKDVGSFRNLGIIGFAVGGAALVGTVIYVLVPAGPSQQQVSAGVSAGPDGARWTLRGSF
jgi:hypothetical protein